MKELKLFNVIGVDEMEMITFSRCTTLEKAQEASKLLSENGYITQIKQDLIPIDTVYYNDKLIEL